MLDHELAHAPPPPLVPLPAYLPAVLPTLWWNAMLDVWMPGQVQPRRSEGCDLVVPDRIAEAGRPALFA